MSPTRPSGLRTGWTTGTCASAAAKAAALGLVTGQVPGTVEVALPGGHRYAFPVEAEGPSRAVVVKDAGDDPDCTNGARITADVAVAEETVLEAGAGVGTVTLPGLGLAVGAPAINPVPHRMILAALAEVTDAALRVTLSVPGGEEMAAKTTNARLGIVGGISILGTTGVVRPFSTAAYRASVVQQVDVAAAQGKDRMVLATGSRSEQAALALVADLDPVCVVEVGDYTGVALRRAAGAGMRHALLVAMAGKITKLAAGTMMTHFHRARVDNALMTEVARATRAPDPVLAAASATATARHFYETCVAHGATAPLDLLC
ncbi:MAG TPA: cobalt-precorrin-5B (C(1))-methyltransferase, partial [Acidimicrobiales bacterium]|nr:cobalt-precorrin-5B (C(1))-methyltransferase [Acidimicrobiales bacterium]